MTTTIKGVRHRHSREDILAGAVEVAGEDGLNQLTFGRVASRLGINDRTVVYYFPTKPDLITAVLTVLGHRLQQLLDTAFTSAVADHQELVATAWPVLARPEVDPTFALYFEAIGLAAAGLHPYHQLAAGLVTGWVDWFAEHLHGDPEHRRAEAEAALAVLDGLLLLRQLAGPDAAHRAAGRWLHRRC